MGKSLKESVLAKCGELWNSYPDDGIWGQSVWLNTGGWFDVRNKTKTICIECKADIPSDDEIWPLAAKILGIEDDQAKKDRIKELKDIAGEAFAIAASNSPKIARGKFVALIARLEVENED